MKDSFVLQRRALIALTVVLFALVTGCKQSPSPAADAGAAGSGATAAAEPIKIGEFASLTGSEAAFGQSSHKGTQLAVEEVNQAGGVLGRKVVHLVEDNRSTSVESVTIVKKFISRDKVVGVLGEVA